MNLRPHLLRDAEYRRSVHQVILEAGTPYEATLQPEFWAHVSRKLKVRDRIELHAQDGSWVAELIVRSSGPVSVNVAPLFKVDLAAAPTSKGELDGVKFQHRGFAKWSAVRLSDKKILTEGHDTEEDARAALRKQSQQAQAA